MSSILTSVVRDPALRLALGIAVAGVLAGAATHKLRNLGEFRRALTDYRLLPAPLIGASAVIIPALELSITAMLLSPGASFIGGVLAALLFAAYGAAIGINLLRGRRHLDCGCSWGGEDGQPISSGLVGRNLVLVFLSLGAAWAPSPRALSGGHLLVAVGTSLTLVVLYLTANRLIANHSLLREPRS